MNQRAEPVPLMFVVPCFGYGGLEQVVLYLARELDRSTFRPSLCTLLAPDPGLRAQLQDCGVDCHVLEKGSGINYGLPVRLARLMRRLGVRLVNAHDIGATLYACAAARLAGVRHVVHTEHSQILTITRRLPAYRWIMGHCVSFSISVSNELARHLTTELRIPGKRITYVPNAIDAGRFANGGDTRRLREELGLGEGDFVVGSIGRLTKQKGHSDLLRAFPAIVQAQPHAKLVLVGDGELRRELEQLARALLIANRVLFTGNRRDVPELLGVFDVFALPSLWEGQPMTLFEAMAAGKPIVATNIADNATILGDGERGSLVEPGDTAALSESISRMARDMAGARALGARAQEHALREFSAGSMARRYEEVFLAVLANNTGVLHG